MANTVHSHRRGTSQYRFSAFNLESYQQRYFSFILFLFESKGISFYSEGKQYLLCQKRLGYTFIVRVNYVCLCNLFQLLYSSYHSALMLPIQFRKSFKASWKCQKGRQLALLRDSFEMTGSLIYKTGTAHVRDTSPWLWEDTPLATTFCQVHPCLLSNSKACA